MFPNENLGFKSKSQKCESKEDKHNKENTLIQGIRQSQFEQTQQSKHATCDTSSMTLDWCISNLQCASSVVIYRVVLPSQMSRYGSNDPRCSRGGKRRSKCLDNGWTGYGLDRHKTIEQHYCDLSVVPNSLLSTSVLNDLNCPRGGKRRAM